MDTITAPRFTAFEVSPVAEIDGTCEAYPDEASRDRDCAEAEETGAEWRPFWSIYGFSEETLTVCIGDFVTEEAALRTLSSLLGQAVPAPSGRHLVIDRS